jgi:hypothetical protein
MLQAEQTSGIFAHAEVHCPKTILPLAMLDLFCQPIYSTSLIALSLSGLAISVYVTQQRMVPIFENSVQAKTVQVRL